MSVTAGVSVSRGVPVRPCEGQRIAARKNRRGVTILKNGDTALRALVERIEAQLAGPPIVEDTAVSPTARAGASAALPSSRRAHGHSFERAL